MTSPLNNINHNDSSSQIFSQLAELQDLLSAERTSSSGAKGEIKEWKSRIEQYKITIGELEAGRLDLDQQIRELKTEMEEQGATFRSQVKLDIISQNQLKHQNFQDELQRQ